MQVIGTITSLCLMALYAVVLRQNRFNKDLLLLANFFVTASQQKANGVQHKPAPSKSGKQIQHLKYIKITSLELLIQFDSRR